MRRLRGDAGQAGGFEALPFGVLIFVAGVLLVVNLWAIVDAKLTVTAAAREAARVYVEAPDASEAEPSALAAARSEIAARGRVAERSTVRVAGDGFARCRMVTIEVSYVVPTITLPFVGGWGDGVRVTARHGEIVDPYRNGPEGASDCA
ncbi:MAG TPA: hypothetical protein VK461_06530 [Acidimicrobiales bacterium]|nr:hypothetical protein [Acidimicrobiales bacterium]